MTTGRPIWSSFACQPGLLCLMLSRSRYALNSDGPGDLQPGIGVDLSPGPVVELEERGMGIVEADELRSGISGRPANRAASWAKKSGSSPRLIVRPSPVIR